jgi:tRNA A37 threonylcarbamoyladenosine dehydratase
MHNWRQRLTEALRQIDAWSRALKDDKLDVMTEALRQIDAWSRALKDDKLDVLTEALRQIDAWSRAYPEKVFPPIDLEKARALLAAGGMTLDAVSADAARHALKGIGEIAREALKSCGAP